MSQSGKFIKSVLVRLGFEIHRRRPYGTDAHRDITNILGEQQAAVIFDVGANVGQTALAFSREFPAATIHSFEPSPEAFTTLASSVAGHGRILTHQIAFGPQSGKSTMYLTRSTLTSSMLRTSEKAESFLGDLVHDSGQVEVTVSSVDDFLREQKIPHVDLLKLDVQGFELEVLKGAAASLRDNRVSLIMTEVNFVDLYERQVFFHDIYAELMRHKYQLVGLYHGDYRTGPFLAWCDALFVDVVALRRRHGLATRANFLHG
jgi:FkbM family methyltransferase